MLFLIATLAVMFAAVQLTQRLVGPESPVPSLSEILVFVVSLVLAIRYRARAAAYFSGLFGAVMASEVLIKSIYGIRSVHSAPVHYTVFLAAIFGIVVGAVNTGKRAEAA